MNSCIPLGTQAFTDAWQRQRRLLRVLHCAVASLCQPAAHLDVEQQHIKQHAALCNLPSPKCFTQESRQHQHSSWARLRPIQQLCSLSTKTPSNHHQQQHHQQPQQQQPKLQDLVQQQQQQAVETPPASWAAQLRQQRLALQQQQQQQSAASSSLEEQLHQLRIQQQQELQSLMLDAKEQQQQQRYRGPDTPGNPQQHEFANLAEPQQSRQQGELQHQQQPGAFSDLGVAPPLLQPLQDLGITRPTPVQLEAWPAIMTGRNVALQSPTGTGKTLAYLLPLLSRLRPWLPVDGYKRAYRSKHPKVLVICPTQELCMQVLRCVRALLPEEPHAAHPIVGGSSISRSAEALKRHAPWVIVATPGRLRKVLVRPLLQPPSCRPGPGGNSPPGSVTLVLEEADKLLSMDDFKALLPHLLVRSTSQLLSLGPAAPSQAEAMRRVLQEYQVLLVSASLKPGALQSADSWISTNPLMVVSKAPADVTPAARAAAAAAAAAGRAVEGPDASPASAPQTKSLPDTITHQVLAYDADRGFLKPLRGALTFFTSQEKKVLVFVGGADSPLDVARSVQKNLTNIKVGALHSAQLGDARASTLAAFNRGDLAVLTTTDGFSLGLDYQGVDVVIGLATSSPNKQAYVARAGRTGRMGRPGTVLTLLPQHYLKGYMRQLRRVAHDMQEVQLVQIRPTEYQLVMKGRM